MPQVNNELIDKLSKLAKLEFDKESTEKMKSDLKTMLEFVNDISKINTDNVEPLIYMSEEKNTA